MILTADGKRLLDFTPPLNLRVSDHLWFREVTCRCWANKNGPFCVGGIVDHRLIETFEIIRKEVGVYLKIETPLPCSSGYRCPVWNSLQPNSSPSSWHLKGMALDIHYPRGRMNLAPFLDIVRSIHKTSGGILLYEWGTHIDLGDPRFIDMR